MQNSTEAIVQIRVSILEQIELYRSFSKWESIFKGGKFPNISFSSKQKLPSQRIQQGWKVHCVARVATHNTLGDTLLNHVLRSNCLRLGAKEGTNPTTDSSPASCVWRHSARTGFSRMQWQGAGQPAHCLIHYPFTTTTTDHTIKEFLLGELFWGNFRSPLLPWKSKNTSLGC